MGLSRRGAPKDQNLAFGLPAQGHIYLGVESSRRAIRSKPGFWIAKVPNEGHVNFRVRLWRRAKMFKTLFLDGQMLKLWFLGEGVPLPPPRAPFSKLLVDNRGAQTSGLKRRRPPITEHLAQRGPQT